MSQPLFIVGVARSGTTYVHQLLNDHPQIRLSYEGRLPTEGWECYRRHRRRNDRRRFDQLLSRFEACDRGEPLNQWIAQALNEQARQALFEWHARTPSFPELIERIYQLPGPRSCWGDKMLRIEMSHVVLRHWPQTRFIVLLRDPRAVYASQKQWSADRRASYSAIYWMVHASWVRQHCLDPHRYLLVKYEELVEHPLDYLTRMLRFAGVATTPWAPQMLAAKPARTTSVDKWRRSLDESEVRAIEAICYDDMRHFGYQPQHAEQAVKVGPCTRAVETLLQYRRRIPLNPAVWRRKNLLKRFWITIRG